MPDKSQTFRDLVKCLSAFALGTSFSAYACFYNDLPLSFAVIGGLMILAATLVAADDASKAN